MHSNFHIYPENHVHSFFRTPSESKGGGNTKIVFMEKDQEENDIFEETSVLCSTCKHKITIRREMISVNGAHQHTFANPNGIIFDIGCYKTAPGCLNTGPFTDEFSWFKGYMWRVSICASCFTHLGWLFLSSGNDYFFGLITDRVIDSP